MPMATRRLSRRCRLEHWRTRGILDQQDVLALLNLIKPVSLNISKDLGSAAGPLYLDSLCAHGISHAEIGAKVALGKIASCACDLPYLREAAYLNACVEENWVAANAMLKFNA